MAACWESSASRRWSRRPRGIKIRRFTFPTHRVVDLFLILIVLAACFHWVSLFELVVSDAHSCRPYIRWIPPQSADKGLLVSLVTPFVPEAHRSPVMPMHTSPSIDTNLSRAETVSSPYIVFVCPYRLPHQMFPRTGPITNSFSPATQTDILRILQREQDRAIALLSSSPLLTSLFVSYANQVAALESASATPSPESEEWKGLQNTIVTLREGIEKLESENIKVTEGLEAAEVSREAFRSQVSSLKEVSTTQENDIRSLRAELAEAKENYDRLMVDSNVEQAALQVRVLDLEVRSGLHQAIG